MVDGAVSEERTTRRGHALALAVVMAACGAHLASVARRGWIPHDEGQLLQTAQRLLAGEVPHRDFFEAYTGGLTALHAVAVALLGEDLLSLRVPFLLASWLMVALVYALAARAAPPAGAALVTLAAYAWGPPVYVASMPTWWVLFLTLAGALALLRWQDDPPGARRAPWLALAGACAGLAFAAKVVGLYALAGLMLALVHDEQAEDAAHAGAAPRDRRGSALVLLGCGAFALVVALTLRKRLGGAEALHLLLPPLAAAGALVAFERHAGARPLAARVRALLARLGPLLLGFAVPAGALLLAFALAGALPELLHGVFVLPMQRLRDVAISPPPVGASLVAALPLVLVVVATASGGEARVRLWATTIAAAAAAFALWRGAGGAAPPGPTQPGTGLDDAHLFVWDLARMSIPLVVTGAAVSLARLDLEPRVRAGLAATALPLGVLTLVQFPYAYGIYLCFAAPLAVVAWAHLLRARPAPRAWSGLQVVLAAFFALFAALWVWRCDLRTIGARFVPERPLARLDLPRGGIDAPQDEVREHLEALAEVERRIGSGALWASPDCPQVYALLGRRNLTPTIYDVFDADFGDPPRRAARLLETLERGGVTVVVLAPTSEFSGPVDPALRAALEARYPRARAGAWFEVRWRD